LAERVVGGCGKLDDATDGAADRRCEQIEVIAALIGTLSS